MQISVRHNIKQVTRQLNNMQLKQIPFAVASSLTKTAKEAQGSIIQRAQHVFDNKKVWYKQQQPTGIKIKPATKTLWVSAVYTDAYFLPLHETGGIKKPFSGQNLAVPAEGVPRRFRKSNALKQFRGEVFKVGSGLYRRKSKKNIQRIYSLTPNAKIDKRLAFIEPAEKVAMRRYESILKAQMARALATAR